MAKDTNIFSCEPIKGGFSYSIASRLGNILNNAEKLFGERNKNYTLLGIELIDRDYPQIWFPDNCGHIVIQITINCLIQLFIS